MRTPTAAWAALLALALFTGELRARAAGEV